MSEVLKGLVRTKLGTRDSRVLRAQGRIPACIQGEGKSHINLSLEADQFLAARRRHEHLFDIECGQDEPETAMVRELQWDAFGDHIIHVEFRRVIRGVETDAEVALKFEGHPKSGILNHLITHLPVRAIPSMIPDSILVKVDEVEAGEPLLAGTIILPEGVSLGIDPDVQVAVAVIARGIIEETTEEEAVEGIEGETPDAPAEPEG